MQLEEITLALFAICNSIRIFAYLPQIHKAATDKNGASAISGTTWSLFLVAHLSTIAHALVNLGDWWLAACFAGNAVCCVAILGIAYWKKRRLGPFPSGDVHHRISLAVVDLEVIDGTRQSAPCPLMAGSRRAYWTRIWRETLGLLWTTIHWSSPQQVDDHCHDADMPARNTGFLHRDGMGLVPMVSGNLLSHARRLAFLLALCGMPAHSALAEEKCSKQIAELGKAARGVSINVSSPRNASVGFPINVSWTAAAGFAAKSPVYAVVAVDGDIRVEASKLSRAKGTEASLADVQDLPGVIVLPGGARAPLDFAFGRDASRILIPLYQPGSKLRGGIAIRTFTAGSQRIRIGVVARTNCGQVLLKAPEERRFELAPGRATIVVQDPYEVETPESVTLSNSGRYRLHSDKTRYRVFDVATGAKLLDRAGREVRFSPTERFIVANLMNKAASQSPGEDLEIIDLLSLEVVDRPSGPVLGWLHSDAFLIDGSSVYGGIAVRQTLISRGSADEDDTLRIYHQMGAHPEGSWSERIGVMLDLDNGIIVTEGRIIEIASGFQRRKSETDKAETLRAKAQEELDRFYAVVPTMVESGWRAREPVLFTHLFSDRQRVRDARLAFVGTIRSDSRQDSDDLSFRLFRRPSDAETQVNLARVTEASDINRSDWRPLARSGSRAAPPKGQSNAPEGAFDYSALAPYGLTLAQLRSVEGPSDSDYAERSALFDLEKPDREAEARLQSRASTRAVRMKSDIGVLESYLRDDRNKVGFPIGDARSAEPRCIDGPSGASALEAAWRWELGGRPLWLVQCFTTVGAAGYGALGHVFLLDGRRGDGQVIDLLQRVKGLLGTNAISSDAALQRGRLYADIFLDRYLVLTARAHGTIAVYDLVSNKPTLVLKDVPQAGLIEQTMMTEDARHIVQINSDGQFFVHNVAEAKTILQGRQVDDEIILFSQEGYYWSSYEGAHFVYLRFPGLQGLHSFHQFAPTLNRPDLISARLRGTIKSFPPAQLSPPPHLEVEVDPQARADNSVRMRVVARSVDRLLRLQVYADGQPAQQIPISGREYSGEVPIDARLMRGWITVLAVDSRGFASRPQRIRLNSPATSSGRMNGLIVGVGAYLDPRQVLPFAGADAERLASALERNAGGYYASAKLVRMVDDQVTARSVLDALRSEVASAQPEDTVIFSFAGHGLDIGGTLYLVPPRYDVNDIAGTMLAWSDVAAILNTARARVVVFLDACHAGRSGSARATTNDEAVQKLLGASRAPMLVFAASKGRQASLEHSHWGGGLFTYAIVEALSDKRSTYDTNRNGILEVSELYMAARAVVGRESLGAQSPWLVRRDLVGDFGLF